MWVKLMLQHLYQSPGTCHVPISEWGVGGCVLVTRSWIRFSGMRSDASGSYATSANSITLPNATIEELTVNHFELRLLLVLRSTCEVGKSIGPRHSGVKSVTFLFIEAVLLSADHISFTQAIKCKETLHIGIKESDLQCHSNSVSCETTFEVLESRIQNAAATDRIFKHYEPCRLIPRLLRSPASCLL